MSRLPFHPLVTIARARRPHRPIERHAWPSPEPRSGHVSLCGDVQYSYTLSDGLAPWCDLCRAAGLGALALTAGAMEITGGRDLSLGPDAEIDTPQGRMIVEWKTLSDEAHERRKAEIDASWAPGELMEAYGR